MTEPKHARITWPDGRTATYPIVAAGRRTLRISFDHIPEEGLEVAVELLNADQKILARGKIRVGETDGKTTDVEVLSAARVTAPPSAGAADVKPEVPEGPPRTAKVTTRLRGRGASVGVAIGIDLGTSNTCVSAVVDGKPIVIPTRWGTTTIPSVLALVDGRIMVGQPAAKRLILNPQETVYGSKRLVGRSFSEELADEFQPYFAYPLVETADHQFGASLGHQVISFEEVAQRVLAEAKAMAAAHLGQPIDRAVITVPAYFGEAQRAAVRRAGRAAGLTVGRIVNEPTAAAVAYGYGRKEKARLLVFDLGGGTFDVSLLELSGHRFEVVATGGDAFLGGIDVDDRIANHLLEEFRKQHHKFVEPEPQQIARLREVAEQCKMGLSVQRKFAVQLQYFAMVDGEQIHLQSSMTQEELTELTADFCQRLVDITKKTLESKDIDPRSVDDVLLVGGSTRLPQVQAAVEALFGRPPSKRINPDEAVALGAALLAETDTSVELIDVLPLSIGVAGKGRRFLRLVSRNTPVPTTRSFVLKTTSENQTCHSVPLFQGERLDAGNNEYLGTILIEPIPAGPPGSEIELTLAFDDQCMLEVSGKMIASDAPVDVRVERLPSIEHVLEELGAYEGPDDALDRLQPQTSGLGWFFSRLRGLFGRKKK